jgi:hypothetical protein
MTGRRWAAMWLGFVVVHAVLIAENLLAPNGPLGDVLNVYPYWWQLGVRGFGWVGLSSAGVYPFLALVPVGFAAQGVTAWFTLVSLLDAIAMLLLARVRPIAAVWWLVFQLALGPIALGRVDAVTVALSVGAVATLQRSPRIAGMLVAAATWVKVWPIALGITAIASPKFARFARWAVGSAIAVLVLGVIIGDLASVLSFLGSQSNRGIQVESVAATPWLWNAWSGGTATVAYNESLITFEVHGTGTELLSLVLTGIQALLLAAVATLIVAARVRAGTVATERWFARFAVTTLAVVMLLIALNKVGSPQFVSWLAVPLVALAIAPGVRVARSSIALVVTVALLTHVLYPYAYFAFLALDTPSLVLATLRNLAEVAQLIVAVAAMFRELRREEFGEQRTHELAVDEEGVVPVRR